jgi:DNA-binding MarR family transcriptional regulator
VSTKSESIPEAAGGAVFEQMHEILFLFRSQLSQRLSKAGEDVPGMAWKVLGFYARHPGSTQTQLVEHSGRDKGQVARLVKQLAERGLLHRSDGTGGKPRGLALTEQGQLVYQRLQRQRAQLANKLTSALSPPEQIQLRRLLEKIKAPLMKWGTDPRER